MRRATDGRRVAGCGRARGGGNGEWYARRMHRLGSGPSQAEGHGWGTGKARVSSGRVQRKQRVVCVPEAWRAERMARRARGATWRLSSGSRSGCATHRALRRGRCVADAQRGHVGGHVVEGEIEDCRQARRARAQARAQAGAESKSAGAGADSESVGVNTESTGAGAESESVGVESDSAGVVRRARARTRARTARPRTRARTARPRARAARAQAQAQRTRSRAWRARARAGRERDKARRSDVARCWAPKSK
jgi:hypothetical protein